MFGLHVCVCSTIRRLCASRDPEKASDSLELEWTVTCELHVGAGHQTWVLCKNDRCSLPPSPFNLI